MPRTDGWAGVGPPSQWLEMCYMSSAVDYLCVMWALVEIWPEGVINLMHQAVMIRPMSGSQERMSVSMTSDDRALIETAAKDAGVSVSAWMVQAAREEARWAIARKMADEIAAEAGVTDEDRAWARSVLGLDSDD
jgi:uncharacterized protein (DUF1778 family)